MKLFESIDGLFVGTRYLTWGIALLGTIASVILFFANLSLGVGSAAVFIATFLLSIGISLLLLPKPLAKAKLESSKKYLVGAVFIILAVVIMGIIWKMNRQKQLNIMVNSWNSVI